MNKLNLYNGGHPLVIEDINLLQDGYREGFAALGSWLTNGNPATSIILSGCQFTPALGGGGTLTPGYIYHQTEIWYTPGGTLIGGGPLYLEPSITYQAPSPVTYASAATHDTRELRTLVIGGGALPANAVYYSSLTPAWQIFKNKATPATDLNLLLPNAGCSFVNSGIWRDITGRVWLKGELNIVPGALSGTPPYTNIPIIQVAGLEPSQTVTIPVLSTLPNYQTYALRIDTLGNISLLTDPATPVALNTKIYLDGVSWL